MKKSRELKLILIITLCIAVIGLPLGFAAFSSTLNISSNLEVNPDPQSFKVVFSSSGTELQTNDIEGGINFKKCNFKCC